MNDKLSLTIFTIEVDGKPVLAFGSKKYSEAETFCADERIRAKLRSVVSGGKPVCDDIAILNVRIARPHEKALYYEQGLVAFDRRSRDRGLSGGIGPQGLRR